MMETCPVLKEEFPVSHRIVGLSDNMIGSQSESIGGSVVERVLKPVTISRKCEVIANQLVELIREGKLKPGDRLLPEHQLSSYLRVGRSSVREALRLLESQGLISSSRGGWVVSSNDVVVEKSLALAMTLDRISTDEIVEMRKIIETETAALAARRATEEDLAVMANAIEKMRAGLDSCEAYISADLEFHMAVVAASRNRGLATMMAAIRDMLRDALAGIYQVPDSAAKALHEHTEIYESIKAHDEQKAHEAMSQHLTRVGKEVSEWEKAHCRQSDESGCG
ncbi:MAG: FadR family transcriptional regulator [Firmicutes bacterium]|nr:FadR family transcriptional regulator [Bacillota bacterium]